MKLGRAPTTQTTGPGCLSAFIVVVATNGVVAFDGRGGGPIGDRG